MENTKNQPPDLELFKFMVDDTAGFAGMFDMNLIPYYINGAGLQLLGIPSLAQLRHTTIANFLFPEDIAFITGQFFHSILKI